MTVIQLMHLSRSITFPIVGQYRGQVGGALFQAVGPGVANQEAEGSAHVEHR